MNKRFILRKGDRDVTHIVALISSLSGDHDYEITVKRAKKERTDLQNNALFGVAYKTLSEFTGYTAPELHDAFLRAYFGEIERDVMGKIVTRPRRTTTTDEDGKRKKLSTDEFQAFYEFIQQKGAEIGCWVPDPDPMWRHTKEQKNAA